jgi:hypothetical protein
LSDTAGKVKRKLNHQDTKNTKVVFKWNGYASYNVGASLAARLSPQRSCDWRQAERSSAESPRAAQAPPLQLDNDLYINCDARRAPLVLLGALGVLVVRTLFLAFLLYPANRSDQIRSTLVGKLI